MNSEKSRTPPLKLSTVLLKAVMGARLESMAVLRSPVAFWSALSMVLEALSIACTICCTISLSSLARSVGSVGATVWSSHSSSRASSVSRSACGLNMERRSVSTMEQATPTSEV